MTRSLPTALALLGLVTAILGLIAVTSDSRQLLALGFTAISIAQGTLYLLLAATMLRYSRIAAVTAAGLLLLDAGLLAFAFHDRVGDTAGAMTAVAAALCLVRLVLAAMLLRSVQDRHAVIVIPMQSPEDAAVDPVADAPKPETVPMPVEAISEPATSLSPTMACPKCAAPQLESAITCSACGIDMPRYVAARQRVAELEARLGRTSPTRKS